MKTLEDDTPKFPTNTITDADMLRKRLDEVVKLRQKLDALTGECEAALAAARAPYEPRLRKWSEQLAGAEEEILAYAIEHDATLFAQGNLVSGRIGELSRRENPEAVALDYDEKATLAKVESKEDLADAFVRVVRSLDKTAIKRAIQAGGDVVKSLKKCGITLTRGVSYKIAPRSEV